MIKSCLLLTLLAGPYSGLAQFVPSPHDRHPSVQEMPALGNDPVFNQVLARRVSYPVRAIRSAAYGRVFAGFDIDSKGHIQHIMILGDEKAERSFEDEVRMALKRMPPLNPHYAGRYALPVSFVYMNWGKNEAPDSPTTSLSGQYLIDRKLLGELIFQGGMQPAGNYTPASRQIVYY